MKRHLGSFAGATALALSLYACSSDNASGGQDGGPRSGEDGGSRGDGSSGPDALDDGQVSADGGADSGDAALDAEIDAGPPAVRFIGRFDMAPAGGPKIAWPGAQIIARFSGTTEVKATFDDAVLFSEYGPNRWEVLIDGVSKQTFQLTRAVTTY